MRKKDVGASIVVKRIENVCTLNHMHQKVGVVLRSVDSGKRIHKADFCGADRSILGAVTHNSGFQFAAIVC